MKKRSKIRKEQVENKVENKDQVENKVEKVEKVENKDQVENKVAKVENKVENKYQGEKVENDLLCAGAPPQIPHCDDCRQSCVRP